MEQEAAQRVLDDAEREREREAQDRVAQAAPALLVALVALLDHYVALAVSGDAGNWDHNQEAEVIAARAAIAEATQEPQA